MNLHNVWERSSPPPAAGQTVGRARRARQRALEAEKSLKYLQALVLRESPELAAGLPPPDGQRTVDRLIECIREEAKSPADWRNLCNFFAVAIDRGNRAGLWDLIAPSPFFTIKRDPLLRDEAYFRRGTLFVAIRAQFAAALNDLHRIEHRWQQLPAEQRAARRGELVLTSALLIGGLCHANLLALLPGTLRSSHIQQCGDQIWLDLRVPGSIAARLNLVGEDDALHRWCPDDLTAALLAHYLKNHSPSAFPAPPDVPVAKQALHVIQSIRDLLTDLGISVPTGMTPTQWCQGAWAAIEREPGGSLPAYLAEYALGRTPSCSLPTARWAKLLNQQVFPGRGVVAPAHSPPKPHSVPFPVLQTGVATKDTNRVARNLLTVFHTKSSKKLTRADCSRSLEALIRGDDLGRHIVAQLLAHWAILLLSHGSSWYRKGLAPSTVYGSYLAPIAQTLIAAIHASGVEDIRELDTDDFEALYEDTLALTRWTDKLIPASALQEFHHYLVTQHGCPELETSIADAKRGTPRVRALIVTEAEYQSARQSLLVGATANPARWELLEMALILGFRAGLRPAEATKLRLVDIFVGARDTVITVRTNRYGSNKNRPSLRRIDLAALCPADEYQWLSSTVARLQALFDRHPQALLLSEAPNRDTRCAYDFFEAHLQPVLRQCTGNPHILYYTLRHSALTRIHLRSEIPDRDHEIHDPNHLRPVDRSLVPTLTGSSRPNSMKRLHAVAAIAGHASPETTLTTYLHGLDLVLYEHVRATLPLLDAVVYAQLLGRHYHSVTRYLKDNRQPDPASAAALRPWIVDALPTHKHPPPDSQTVVMPTAPAPQPTIRLTVNNIQRILTDHDNGFPLAVIAKRSGTDEPGCKALIDAARTLASIQSNKGRPRLITQRRLVQSAGQSAPICPSYPQSEQDVQLALRMIDRLRPLIPATGALGDIAPAIEYFLRHVEANNSGVRFYEPSKATLFVALFAEIAGDHRMIYGTHVHSVRSTLDAAAQRAHWAQHLNIRVRKDHKRPPLKRDGGEHGKLTISLALKTSQGKPVSAHAYKYVLHLAAIAMLSRGRIHLSRIQQPTGATNAPPAPVP